VLNWSFFYGDYLTPCENALSYTTSAYCVINEYIYWSESNRDVSQIQKFIISVASPLILIHDFYDKNILRAAVFIDKGRIVADRCARFDLILLNADTDTSVPTAWNLIYT
jgi:hypothetical protein